MHCRPLQQTGYTESGMSLITVWMCVLWPKVHTLKDCDSRMRSLDSFRCWQRARVKWEIRFLITSEIAPFFCECPNTCMSFHKAFLTRHQFLPKSTISWRSGYWDHIAWNLHCYNILQSYWPCSGDTSACFPLAVDFQFLHSPWIVIANVSLRRP
jgi:hypothetical protein